MMKKYLSLLLICLLAWPAMAGERKKVAVVLGGGGAKGVAHIGVLKVLEEAGIPIDIVAGTSMGAIVGGLYAIGYSPDEIKRMVELQDWDMLLSDKVKRSHLLFPEKEKAERYIVSLPFGLEKKDRVIDGVVKGQNLQNLFSDLTIGYHDSVDFNSFLIPFACVAVDMVSGKDYVFHKGSLPLAMRASMAIPAVFTPVRLDSMVLVDGGLNNNYPVDVALAMGADIVIGVDLATSDLRSYDRLHSPGDIATQIIALHGHDKYERNRDRTDLLFRPDMEPYRSSSFAPAALDTMLHRGEADARRRWNEIMALKRRIGLSDTDTFSIQSRRLAHRPVLPADTFYVRHIRFDGADPRDLNWLHRICALKENSHITLKELRKSMSILVGTNAYAYVNYKLTGESQQDLVLTLQPKSESSVNLRRWYFVIAMNINWRWARSVASLTSYWRMNGWQAHLSHSQWLQSAVNHGISLVTVPKLPPCRVRQHNGPRYLPVLARNWKMSAWVAAAWQGLTDMKRKTMKIRSGSMSYPGIRLCSDCRVTAVWRPDIPAVAR